MSVVRGPSSNLWVQLGNEITCLCLFIGPYDFPNVLQEGMSALLRGLNQQRSVVFTEVLSEKIKAILYVRDDGFLRGEHQPTLLHELLHKGLDLAFQDLFGFASDDEIISKTNEIDLFRLFCLMRLWKTFLKVSFEAI